MPAPQSRQTLSPSVQFVEVTANNDGQRVDNFLLRKLKGAPRSLIYRIVRKGEVRINKKRCKPDTRLQQGDVVRIPPVRLGESKGVKIDPENYRWLEQTILHEDKQLMIINKPAGLAVHSGTNIQTGVIEALRMIRPQQAFLELAHRLDRQTSGCLVLAKSRSALLAVQKQLSEQKGSNLSKIYRALIKGKLELERIVEAPLAMTKLENGDRRTMVDASGKPAVSVFRPLEHWSDLATLVEIDLLTGRNHQARVHAQSLDHPIAGDDKYGDWAFNRIMKSRFGLKRLFLHAYSIQLIHPATSRSIRVTAELPDDLSRALERMPR